MRFAAMRRITAQRDTATHRNASRGELTLGLKLQIESQQKFDDWLR